MAHPSSAAAEQDFGGKKLRVEGRDSGSLYLETRGLAGQTIPCQVD